MNIIIQPVRVKVKPISLNHDEKNVESKASIWMILIFQHVRRGQRIQKLGINTPEVELVVAFLRCRMYYSDEELFGLIQKRDCFM